MGIIKVGWPTLQRRRRQASGKPLEIILSRCLGGRRNPQRKFLLVGGKPKPTVRGIARR